MRKRIAVLLAILAGVLLLAAAAFLIFFPADRTGRILADRVAGALGAPVSLEEARPSLRPLGLAFRGLRVEGGGVPGGAPDVTLREGTLDLRFLPLLRRRIEVDRVLLTGLDVTFVLPEREAVQEGAPPSPADGAPPIAAPPGEQAVSEGSSFALLLSSAEIREANLRLIDPADGGEIRLEGIEARTGLRAERDGEAEARGEVTIERVTASRLDSAGLAGGIGPIRIRYDGLYRADGTAEVREIAVALRDLEIAFNGSLAGLPDEPEGTLSFSAPGLETADLLSLLPVPADGPLPWSGRGPVSLDGEVALRPPAPVDFRVLLVLGGLEVRREGAAEPIRSVTGRLEITPEEVRLENVGAVIGADSVRIDGTAAPLREPRIDLAVIGAVDLEALARTGLLPAGVTAKGAVRLDLRAAGPAAEPEKIRLSGSARFDRVAYRSAAPDLDVAGGSGELLFEENRLRLNKLKAKLNGSPLELTARIDDPLGARRVDADLRLGRLDLDRILAPLDSTAAPAKGGAKRTAPAAPAGPPLPPVPPITLSGRARIDTIVTGGNLFLGFEAKPSLTGGNGPLAATMGTAVIGDIRLRKARADLVLKDGSLGGILAADSAALGRVPLHDMRCRLALGLEGRLAVDSVRARVFRGRIEGDARVDIRGRDDSSYRARVRAEEMEANDFLSRLTPARDVLFGRFQMESEWEGRGLSPDTMLAHLAAAGTMRVENGRLRNLEAIDMISELLGRGKTGELPFRALWSDFAVRDRKVVFDDLQARADDADWTVSGSIGFGGALDYKIQALLSEELSRKYRGNALLGALLGGGEGRVPVHLRLTGTTKKPKVSLDAAETLDGGVGGVLKRLQGK
ncbi:MAG: hypothetical protein JW958_03910 [Candidatus Eisenbacteria bacterium]|nr:hypothetical protein [Candidatus Eisenbacteria bacterium]